MGDRITFRTNDASTPPYLARPAHPGPGIIVIQEWWGLVPHIENVADRFAALDRTLTDLGKPHEFHTYAAATHAFFNEERPEVYDPAAAKDAWAKTHAFFRRELRA